MGYSDFQTLFSFLKITLYKVCQENIDSEYDIHV